MQKLSTFIYLTLAEYLHDSGFKNNHVVTFDTSLYNGFEHFNLRNSLSYVTIEVDPDLD